jgi:hypothetical protein
LTEADFAKLSKALFGEMEKKYILFFLPWLYFLLIIHVTEYQKHENTWYTLFFILWQKRKAASKIRDAGFDTFSLQKISAITTVENVASQ